MTFAFAGLFGALALLFAVLVVTLRQPMRAALALIAHMVSLAAIYATLEVHVVALFQVLIYVAAVMVFMVYSIMLLDDRDASYRQPYSRLAVPGLVMASLVAAVLLWSLGPESPEAVSVDAPTQPAPFAFTAFARAFMQRYWFHFEVATVLLLVGIVASWTAIRESR
jgi:NADH-quinone oxidoreductase subunit J